MADKDQYNDEYQFADLDAMGPDVGDMGETAESDSNPSAEASPSVDKNNIKRNALIAVGIVILAMVAYKLMGSFFSEKEMPIKTIASSVPKVAPMPVQIQSAVPPPEPTLSSAAGKITQQLSALELGQQNMRSDVSSVNEQLGGMSSNVNAMIAKMSELNGIIANLSAKVNEQSHEIEQLTIRREAKKVQHVARKPIHYPKYYLQAVIPGRAWLIATNGATLTVREGTIIAGYGMVKLIDPNQGRVSTSSGQVIRFSQADS